MALLIVGLVLLLVAAGANWYARNQRRQALAVTATETSTCGDLVSLARSVRDEVGGAGFEQQSEVVGRAVAEDGTATAPTSGTPVVWYRTQITHRYWEMQQTTVDGKQQWNRVERTETVSDVTSAAAFSIDDGTGSVLVAPDGADVDHPEKIVDRFEQSTGSNSSGLLDSVLSGVIRSGSQSGTLGFRTEEWVIRPGARVYVHGEVSDSTGQLRFRKPQKGRYVVSTRSEEEIVGDDERAARWSTIGGAVSAVAGVALIVAGIATVAT